MDEHTIIQHGAELKELKTHELTEHQINDCNRHIKIIATDYGDGEFSKWVGYKIIVPDKSRNLAYDASREDQHDTFDIFFQNGSTVNYGYNGLTLEALCAIMIDRFKYYQTTEYKTNDNQKCIEKLEEIIQLQKDRGEDYTENTTQPIDKKV